jgi:hypothetical protein
MGKQADNFHEAVDDAMRGKGFARIREFEGAAACGGR